MELLKYPSADAVDAQMQAKEPLLVLISFEGTQAIIAPIDEAVEHHILLERTGRDSRDIDKYFRIVLDDDGADWTFVCPPDYQGIRDKKRRIEQFYKDGFSIIPQALQALGYLVGINIPRRYCRHFNMMGESSL